MVLPISTMPFRFFGSKVVCCNWLIIPDKLAPTKPTAPSHFGTISSLSNCGSCREIVPLETLYCDSSSPHRPRILAIHEWSTPVMDKADLA